MQRLGFIGLCRIFIGNGNAYVGTLIGLCAPVAGVNVSLIIGNGRNQLGTNGLTDPQAFQGLGIEGLDSSIFQGCKDHAIAVCQRVQVIGSRCGCTGTFPQNLAIRTIHLVDGFSTLNV